MMSKTNVTENIRAVMYVANKLIEDQDLIYTPQQKTLLRTFSMALAFKLLSNKVKLVNEEVSNLRKEAAKNA